MGGRTVNAHQRRLAQKEARRRELESRNHLDRRQRDDVDRDLPASLQRLGLLRVNRGPYDADYPYDPYRTPIIRRPR